MNIFKKFSLAVISILLCMNLFVISANAGNLSYTSYNDEEGYRYMTLSGTGAIPDYTPTLDCPGDVIPGWRSSNDPARYTHFLTINEGITHIGKYAFYKMLNLQDVTLPNSLKSIGDYAFSRLPHIFSIHIPDSVTYISDNAFSWTNKKTIYCSSTSYAYQYALANDIDVILTDVVYLERVSLDHTQISLDVGDTFKLNATIQPSGVKNPSVTWTSSSPSVATVNSNGVVTAHKGGSATITVTVTATGKTRSANCSVYVNEPKPVASSVNISESSLTLLKGDEYSLYANISPYNATGTIVWKSSNTKVATVSEYGYIKAVGSGTAKITASVNTGTKIISDTCKVTVKLPKDISKLKFTITGTKVTYGLATDIPKIKIKDGSYLLHESEDYIIDYLTNTNNVGRQKIAVRGINKYTGSKSISYTIVPNAPEYLEASLYKANAVSLTWYNPEGASGCSVYRKIGSGSYKLIRRTTKNHDNSDIAFKVSGLKKGVKYTFKVVPYYKTDNGTIYSSLRYKTVSIYTLKQIKAPTVQKQFNKKTCKKVVVFWKEIKGADGYQISQSTSKSKIKALSRNVSLIPATKNKTYYYRVRAYKYENGKYIYGKWSKPTKYKLK